MIHRQMIALAGSVVLAFCLSCSTNTPERAIDYLGQRPPGLTPSVFAPGFVSTELDEFGCAMSPDGREFYFTRTMRNPSRHVIMVSRLGSSGWTPPEPAPFPSEHSQGEPNFSPDGGRLLFGRLRPSPNGRLAPEIWSVRRSGRDWDEPRPLVPGMFASAAADGTIYLTDVSRGMERADIAVLHPGDRGAGGPEILDAPVNGSFQDAHPYIAPDAGLLLFDSNRPGGVGESDLYVCFRREDGSWTEPAGLGPGVNTPAYDAIPSLSPDGKYLFFNRSGDIYWVSTAVIERVKRL